jgi:putative oxidoreductase
MIFPQLARFSDVAPLLLRLMVGIVFLTSGYKVLKDPETRGKDMGMSKVRSFNEPPVSAFISE